MKFLCFALLQRARRLRRAEGFLVAAWFAHFLTLCCRIWVEVMVGILAVSTQPGMAYLPVAGVCAPCERGARLSTLAASWQIVQVAGMRAQQMREAQQNT